MGDGPFSSQKSLGSQWYIYDTLYLYFIPAWISNFIHHELWYEITYPFQNLTGPTVEVLKWISNFIPPLTRYVITYPYFPGVELKLISMKYTTDKTMENLESTMETRLIDILICKASISYFNAVLMCSVMGQTCNLQCPKLKIRNRIFSNLSFPDISLTTSQDIPHHIMNLPIFCA